MEKNFSLNRFSIKIIAITTMFLDHLGFLLYSHIPIELYYFLRSIGRLSFPLFSYFIATGFYHTSNKKRYIINLLCFALISQIPFVLFFNYNWFNFNILFTFLIAILFMNLFDKLFRENSTKNKITYILIVIFSLIFINLLKIMGITFDYSTFGILLTFLFYIFIYNKNYQILSFVILQVLNFLLQIIFYGSTYIFNYIQLISLLSIIWIALYNGQKGKINLKYFFYIFYPMHLMILYIISIFI